MMVSCVEMYIEVVTLRLVLFFFFFQAEDGIRDLTVTGVQTCALPICSEHALQLIEQIVHEASCPVVALLHAPDHEFVLEAAKRGVFAYVTDGEPQEIGRASCRERV